MDIAQMILIKFTYALSFWIVGAIFIMSKTIKRAFLGFFIFILASVSIVVAAVVGVVEGHTTDIGFLQGGLLGVVAGAIIAVQVFGPVLHGDDQPLSKVALLRRVVNGKAIMGVVRPFLLKAYQWQMIAMDTSYIETSYSYMYDFNQETKGLSKNSIKNIPTFYSCSTTSCPICLEDMEEGEIGRKLERCGHSFHMICLDEWLLRQETCPLCRDHLTYYNSST